MKSSDWMFVIDRIKRRKSGGKESRVCFNGQPIPETKLKKEGQRHGIKDVHPDYSRFGKPGMIVITGFFK